MSDVTPLPSRNKASLDKPRPKPNVRSRDRHSAVHDDLSDRAFEHEPGAALNFARPGVQRQALRQLRRGGSAVERELDLHGLTAAEARKMLTAFLGACAREGVRRARVIHGKGLRSDTGEGVLKGLVAGWLAQRDDVLAFTQAPAREGGSGAVIVLLRNPNV